MQHIHLATRDEYTQRAKSHSLEITCGALACLLGIEVSVEVVQAHDDGWHCEQYEVPKNYVDSKNDLTKLGDLCRIRCVEAASKIKVRQAFLG